MPIIITQLSNLCFFLCVTQCVDVMKKLQTYTKRWSLVRVPFVFEARAHRNCRYRTLLFLNTKECCSLLLEISLVEPDLSISVQHTSLMRCRVIKFYELIYQQKRKAVTSLEEKRFIFCYFFPFIFNFCKQDNYPK